MSLRGALRRGNPGSPRSFCQPLQNFLISSTLRAPWEIKLRSVGRTQPGMTMDRINESNLEPASKKPRFSLGKSWRKRSRTTRTAIALAVAVALGGGGYYGWQAWNGST